MGDVPLRARVLPAAVALQKGEAQRGAEFAQLQPSQPDRQHHAGAQEQRDEEPWPPQEGVEGLKAITDDAKAPAGAAGAAGAIEAEPAEPIEPAE